MTFPIESVREHFPALQRQLNGRTVCHFDGPAGSQVPQMVACSMSDYLLNTNSNRSAPFVVSQESDERVEAGHSALGGFSRNHRHWRNCIWTEYDLADVYSQSGNLANLATW